MASISMESIFDHNITASELEYLFIKYKKREDYESFTQAHSKYADLYLLYNLRGDGDKAEYYLEKVVGEAL
jgi:hypothetical protein